MSRRLQISITSTEGALIRVLGTVERRGYSLSSLQVEKNESGMQISMQIESDRDANVLCRQLDRLFDVQSVVLEAEPALVEAPRFQATWL